MFPTAIEQNLPFDAMSSTGQHLSRQGQLFIRSREATHPRTGRRGLTLTVAIPAAAWTQPPRTAAHPGATSRSL